MQADQTERSGPAENRAAAYNHFTRTDGTAQYRRSAAYDAGYRTAVADLAERAVELDAWKPLPRRTWTERVTERVALFERCAEQQHTRRGTRAWHGLENGDRVDVWDGPYDLTASANAAERCRVAAGARPVWTDWRQVHRDVTPEVWHTVWAALNDRTRESIADLDPYRLGGGR